MFEKEANTQGGTVIDGDVNTKGGHFTGRDSIISIVNKIDGSITVTIMAMVAVTTIAIIIIVRHTPDKNIPTETVTLNFQSQIAKDYNLSVEDQAYVVALLLSLRDLAVDYNGANLNSITSLNKQNIISSEITESSSMIFSSDLIIAGRTNIKDIKVINDFVILLYFIRDSEHVIIVKNYEIQELPKKFFYDFFV